MVTSGTSSWRPVILAAAPSRVQTRHKKDACRHFFVRKVFLCLLVIETFQIAVKAAVWTNGPEDRFFCGYKWDDKDCRSRQHCPSGMSSECEFEDLGMKCFANTQCDTRFGHGDWFVSGKAPNQAPGGGGGGSSRPTYTGKSDNPIDHYWCGVGLEDANSKCGVPCPGGVSSECPQGNACYHDVYDCDARNLPPPTPTPTSLPPSGSPVIKDAPTKYPTDMPIEPPPPLGTSEDSTDHWFCGVGLDNANSICRVHCPTAKECPVGQICYFGTQCDARTHAPTPPPSRRPTTPAPSLSPTTIPPTGSPTDSSRPSLEPSEQIPTKSPTPSPTKRPTYAPMPSLQASFYCGKDWNDAIENCKKKCPTGESTECPFDEECFSLTPCTEEKGYPDDEYGPVGGNTSGSGGGANIPQACVPLQVTVIADHWPKETTWAVVDTITEKILVEGTNDDLVPGEPVEWLECINNKLGCYEFTIYDSNGDGMCCGHGAGSYTAKYDGEEIVSGAAFYDSETTPFGSCGETDPPTDEPTKPPSLKGGGGSPDAQAYRCVSKEQAKSKYEVPHGKCDQLVNCYNSFIDIGDDFFCDKESECIEAQACRAKSKAYRCVADALVDSGYIVSSKNCGLFSSCDGVGDSSCESGETCIESTNCAHDETAGDMPGPSASGNSKPSDSKPPQEQIPPPTTKPTVISGAQNFGGARPTVSKPRPPSPSSNVEPELPANPSKVSPGPTTTKPTPIRTSKPTRVRKTPPPTVGETEIPTLMPSSLMPTLGPCDGAPCRIDTHCRSKFGFCGPGDTYCSSSAVWTSACPPPTKPPVTASPSIPPNTMAPVFAIPIPDKAPESDPPSPPPSPPPQAVFVKPKPSGGAKKPAVKPKPKPEATTNKPAESPIPIPATAKPTKPLTRSPTEYPVTDNPTTQAPLSFIDNFMENPLTRAPTSRPSPSPTKRLTPRPTSFFDNQNQQPVPILDSSQTNTATEVGLDGESQEESVDTPEFSAGASDFKPLNEFECTGEPCPVDTHCRSRYGSCGPGFIYCNIYSAWKRSCPAFAPGTRPIAPGNMPTRRPTPRPSSFFDRKPQNGNDGSLSLPGFSPSAAESSSTSSDKTPAALPTLAKPTLPDITPRMASKFATPVEFPDPYVATDEGEDEADSDEDKNAKPDAAHNSTEKQQTDSVFQSADYLDQWLAGREPSVNQEDQNFNWDKVYSSSLCLSALRSLLSLAAISFLLA